MPFRRTDPCSLPDSYELAVGGPAGLLAGKTLAVLPQGLLSCSKDSDLIGGCPDPAAAGHLRSLYVDWRSLYVDWEESCQIRELFNRSQRSAVRAQLTPVLPLSFPVFQTAQPPLGVEKLTTSHRADGPLPAPALVAFRPLSLGKVADRVRPLDHA